MPIVERGSAFLARFTLDPLKVDAFRAAHRAIMEKGAAYMDEQSHFVFYGWGRQCNEFVAIECWKDQEMLNKLRNDPDFRSNVRSMLDCCTAPVEIEMFAGHAGDRSAFALYPVGPSEFHPTSNGQHVEFI